MNIAFVSNLWPPTIFGGYEILASQVAETLRGQGHRVRVLTSDFVTDGPKDVAPLLALTTPFPRQGENVGAVDFSLRRQAAVARFNQRVTREWLEDLPAGFEDGRGADVVFCWCLNRLSLGPVRAAQALRIPVCQTINDFHPRQFRAAEPFSGVRQLIRHLAERTLFHGTTLAGRPFPVAFISEALEQGLVEEGVRFSHRRVIRQGAPLEELPFSPRRRQSGEILDAVYIGQLSPTKGVHTLIRAIGVSKRLGRLRVRLRIVGAGVPAYEARLRRLVKEQGLEGLVELVGRVDRSQVGEWHRRSHVLVFPSEWPEPFGLSHLEAMASGCAVVSTTTGGSSELIRDRVNALAFRAGDPEDLARCLDQLDDEPLRRSLIENAREGVEREYSLDGYCRQLVGFLEDTIEAGSRRNLEKTSAGLFRSLGLLRR